MTALWETRRYLTDFDSRRISHILTDVLVIGSGVAGARAAIEASTHGDVILMCKQDFEASATRHAQGGIAAARADGDDLNVHYEDTLRVGGRLTRAEAVRRLVDEAPARIEELIEWGIEFDRVDGKLARTREGGHSVSRILHARGDRTGLELVRTLRHRVQQCSNIRVFENCFLIDLLTVGGAGERGRAGGTCYGAVTFHPQHGHQLIWAAQTVLATGGCGQVWRETTNPPGATGDGFAAAFRAGATLKNMELMQFHPTTLYVAGAGRALISEAVRGEGAYLVDRAGERFMPAHHPDAELAPRDIVSRVIHQHLTETRSNSVFLDVRHLKNFEGRFPYIAQLCADFKIDVKRDLIPVRPSAHYMIGGVAVGLDGSSDLPGLLACGEASCTGIHGANRMASNSLLEGVVFGRIAGETAGLRAAEGRRLPPVGAVISRNEPSSRTPLDVADIRNSLASVMWRNVGIVRWAERLRETCDILDFWAHYTLDKTLDNVPGWEIQDKLMVARMIAACALERSESVGVHFRADQPAPRASDAPLGAPVESTDSEAAAYDVAIRRTTDGAETQRRPC